MTGESIDQKTFRVASYVRNALEIVKDERTAVDSGGGEFVRDLWVKIEGDEFLITITNKTKTECRDAEN